MKHNDQKDEILLSWRRCMEQNLSTTGNRKKITEEELNILLHKNNILISTFEDTLENIQNSRYLFLYYRIKTN
jgi:transcriptional regulator of acetoin/glycerol metabolism